MPARFHLLHAGYIRDAGMTVGSSVSLVEDDGVVIVVDPGLVAKPDGILRPLADLGLGPGDVTHVVLTHHHPDHTINAALFPKAEVVDAWAHYRGDQWIDHDGDGHRLSPHVRLILTPGHTAEDLTMLAETDDGVVACTHAWWRTDRTPAVDPGADDQAALEASRQRILELADLVVPGHGEPFVTERRRGPAR
ncbi:MAG TPA: MBL fold metallo-hydrolase [Candidatus Limnocylindria bacterium]|nr:MBL fold metallo-hydrolase [Candidatus Limnocylindria bacterium]